ncbi:MAG: intradiol ring-cleavage dioxygenase [Caldilineaceae bacterium]
MIENDDLPVGRILSRREILILFGATGAALLAGCAPIQPNSTQPKSAATPATASGVTLTVATGNVVTAPACIVRPEMTEGPYFVDEQLNRFDIRTDPSDGSVREGAPLQLSFALSQVNNSGCTPLAGALVDIWHCDAAGVYSDVADPGFNTKGKKFLRGYQVTDAQGVAKFLTIYPGWYRGRTVHIHFKIRTNAGSGAAHEFISQLFFDDAFTDQVYTQPPYADKGERTVRNQGDGIYRNGGDQLLLSPSKAEQGYNATFAVGLNWA